MNGNVCTRNNQVEHLRWSGDRRKRDPASAVIEQQVLLDGGGGMLRY
jgi:hypothetical protein